MFFADVGDNKTNEPDNEEESVKECEGEEEKEEITLRTDSKCIAYQFPSIRNSR